jgi:hypothetical protein
MLVTIVMAMGFYFLNAAAMEPTAGTLLKTLPCFSSKKYALTSRSTCIIVENEDHKVRVIQPFSLYALR